MGRSAVVVGETATVGVGADTARAGVAGAVAAEDMATALPGASLIATWMAPAEGECRVARAIHTRMIYIESLAGASC